MGQSRGSGHQDDLRRGSGRGQALEKVTVNLTSRSVAALEQVVVATGESKTDVINKALQIYAYIREHLDAGGALYVKDAGSKEAERIRIF